MLSVSELGIRLKNAREEKGYSLDELQRVTKIQKRYLIAIEDGDFSKMPGDFYGRAFVKSYAEAVELDPDMIFEEHKNELPQTKKEPVDLPPRVNRSKPKTVRKKSKIASLLPTLVVILFILAIGLAFWIFRQGDTDDSGGVPRDNQEAPSIEITDNDVEEDNNVENNNEGANDNNASNNEENEENEEEQEQSLSFEESEGNRYTYTLTGIDDLDVSLSFSGDSWLQILDSNGDEVHQSSHGDGDEIDFDLSGESEITFNMGNIRTADIYINDELLDYESDDHRQYVIIRVED
ncbi:helix-turn-helix domain-containing protein [Salipaludibacillus agaradhaerens]|uniref:helix-turn-helix domain-containing protein n=1 Tax=Salipaludibacillus agaradhaerens TaxID=76935 RepID=UPI0009960609